MKKTIILSFCILLGCSFSVQAQSFKFAHINLQELVMLMPEYDSAVVQYGKYTTELQETYDGIETEYRTKFLEYQQKSGAWSAAILEAKQQELQSIEQSLQRFAQNAQQEMTQMQQTLYGPAYQKANETIQKLGKEHKFTYIYELGSGALSYFDEEQSVNLLPLAKAALGIPADKTLPTPQPQTGAR